MQFGSSLILWRCLVFEDTVLSEIYLSKLLKRCLCVFSKSVGLQSNLLRKCLTWNEWYRSTTKGIPSIQRTGFSANCLWGLCCVHDTTFDTKTLVNPKIAPSEHLPEKSSALRSQFEKRKPFASPISAFRHVLAAPALPPPWQKLPRPSAVESWWPRLWLSPWAAQAKRCCSEPLGRCCETTAPIPADKWGTMESLEFVFKTVFGCDGLCNVFLSYQIISSFTFTGKLANIDGYL